MALLRKFDKVSVCIDSDSCARLDRQAIHVDAVNATSDFVVRLKHYEIDGFGTEFVDEKFDSGRSSNSGSDDHNTRRLANSVIRGTILLKMNLSTFEEMTSGDAECSNSSRSGSSIGDGVILKTFLTMKRTVAHVFRLQTRCDLAANRTRLLEIGRRPRSAGTARKARVINSITVDAAEAPESYIQLAITSSLMKILILIQCLGR